MFIGVPYEGWARIEIAAPGCMLPGSMHPGAAILSRADFDLALRIFDSLSHCSFNINSFAESERGKKEISWRVSTFKSSN